MWEASWLEKNGKKKLCLLELRRILVLGLGLGLGLVRCGAVVARAQKAKTQLMNDKAIHYYCVQRR